MHGGTTPSTTTNNSQTVNFTQADKKYLPYAGLSNNIIKIIILAILAISAILGIKYKEYKNIKK